MKELDRKLLDIKTQYAKAESAEKRNAILRAPEKPFTCVFNKGVCKDNGNLLEIHDPLRKQYLGVYEEIDRRERELLAESKFDWQSAAELAGHAQALTKSIAGLHSDFGGGSGGAATAASGGRGLASEQSLRADRRGADFGEGSAGAPPESARGGKPGKSSAGEVSGGEVAEHIVADGLPAMKFAVNAGVAGEVENPEAELAATPLVPDSFLKRLDERLAEIGEEKSALAVIRELGKSAGIDELASLGSLDELEKLEKSATQLRRKNAANPEAADANSGASQAPALESGNSAGGGALSEADAQYIQAVESVLEERRPNWNMAATASALPPETTPGEWTTGIARRPAHSGQGIGVKSADVFARVRKASHIFYRKNYM